MLKTRSYSFYHNISIAILLCLTPIVYIGFVKYFLRELFHNSQSLFLFLLYNVPFWVVFMMIIGMEIYRRTIINTRGLPFYFVIPVVSIFIAVVGIVITPVGPVLISTGALQLIVTNTIIGTMVGIIISVKPGKNK